MLIIARSYSFDALVLSLHQITLIPVIFRDMHEIEHATAVTQRRVLDIIINAVLDIASLQAPSVLVRESASFKDLCSCGSFVGNFGIVDASDVHDVDS